MGSHRVRKVSACFPLLRRRIEGWVRNGLAVMSVVLCLLWVRSEWRNDAILRMATPVTWIIQSNHGDVALTYRRIYGITWDHALWHFDSSKAFDWGRDYPPTGYYGFSHQRLTHKQAATAGDPAYAFMQQEWTVPYWFLFSVCAGVLAVERGYRLVGWAVRRGRLLRGRCVTCGYELNGNVSGVCPECGGKIAEGVGRVS